MRFARALLVAAVLAIVVAPSASAQSRCVAPPGSSAVDEYCEVVPDGTGGSGNGGGGSSIPDKAATQLQKAGPAGQAVLSFSGEPDAGKQTPSDKSGGGKDGGSSASSVKPQLQDTDAGAKSNNVIEAAAASASDSTRVGSGFIWVLLAGIALMGGWGWIAFRRRNSGDS
jgi:LPXTG-motif cell wall-anchored protein